jgi:hypothetical protein
MSNPVYLDQHSRERPFAENSAAQDSAVTTADLVHMAAAYRRFCRLLELAESKIQGGEYAAAAAIAKIAARIAYPGNVGLFTSHRLERILCELGKHVDQVKSTGGQRTARRRRVLHVLSYCKPIGGDTRLAWRWIREDPDSQHSVAITTQADLSGTYEIPGIIKQCALQSGGSVYTLKAPTSKPLDQAAELRGLCQDADIVVLHTFPYDIVPVLALSHGCENAKTILDNLSDHTFWVGGSVAHEILHLRTQSPEFVQARRGLNPVRSSLLPIPLDGLSRTISQAEAKQRLGYDPDSILLLTIATPFKYASPGQVSFLELVTPVVASQPRVQLIAVGPSGNGAWQAASEKTGGRIHAMGIRWDNDLWNAAADIYLDSVPFSSITSLLEAGLREIPLLGYRAADPDLSLLGPGAPGLDGAMIVAPDAACYRQSLTSLITDGAFRNQIGRSVRDKIMALHSGTNWATSVQAVYEKLERATSRGCLLDGDDAFQVSALNVALTRLYPELSVAKQVAHCVEALPYRSRLSTMVGLYSSGFGGSPHNLLPFSLNVAARRAGSWTKKKIRRGMARRLSA